MCFTKIKATTKKNLRNKKNMVTVKISPAELWNKVVFLIMIQDVDKFKRFQENQEIPSQRIWKGAQRKN